MNQQHIADSTITGSTRLTGLLGSPVRHSISPLMHNAAFRILGLDYVYLCFEVNEDSLEEAVRGLRACGIAGFNLTMPNKTRILPCLDSLSVSARLIGAVNTVVNENGVLKGYNTDGIGFMQAVRESGVSIRGAGITLMGGGGAATAIAVQAALDGAGQINIFVRPTSRYYERTLRKAEMLSSNTSCQVNVYDHADTTALRASLESSTLLVNATSIGMAPDTDHSVIEDPNLLNSRLAVADVVYHPLETRLLKDAADRGCTVIHGTGMLLYQGVEAFRLFTGHEMPVEEIRRRFFSERT